MVIDVVENEFEKTIIEKAVVSKAESGPTPHAGRLGCRREVSVGLLGKLAQCKQSFEMAPPSA